jgi:hypothetical protein
VVVQDGDLRMSTTDRELGSGLDVTGRPTGGWVAVDACTLPTAERPLRVAEFDSLFSTSLRAVERPGPAWLRLRLDPDPRVWTVTRELVDRESNCCSFFDFQLARDDNDLVVDVRVPAGRVDVLDGLGRRADAARTGSDAGS